jgi:putative methyltransferase (TIGR04325 family)
MKNKLSPIVLFTYNRPNHTRQTVEALQKNHLAQDSQLFIYSDEPKSQAAKEQVTEVREYLKTIKGFKEITIIEREENWGLANSIIDGVTQIVNEYGRVIVLEDDLVTSPYFLQFMNEALAFYQDEEQVISIHGYVYPIKNKLPETFFIRGADCWGWATWQRGWQLFESDGSKLLKELKQQHLEKEFDFNNTYDYTKMLEQQIMGKNNSWAVRWYASAFLKNKLTLYPSRSLIHNIGNDFSGTHCGATDSFATDITQKPILIKKIVVEENNNARIEFEKIFLKLRNSSSSIKNKLKFMQYRLKPIIKDITPPIILRTIKNITNRGGISFKGKYNSWNEAVKHATGYDTELILEKVKNASLQVKNGEAVYERDSVLFDKIEYSFPVLAALLRVAIANDGKLNVLDFGGSLGSSYYQCKTFLSDLDSLQWNIIEQPHFVNCGKELFADKTLKFYETIDECLMEQKPNVVLLSSVLQYLEKPYELLDKIYDLNIKYLIIDNTPTKINSEILTVQIVPKSIFNATIPSWIFDYNNLLKYLENSYFCVYEFNLDYEARYDNDIVQYNGFFLNLDKNEK